MAKWKMLIWMPLGTSLCLAAPATQVRDDVMLEVRQSGNSTLLPYSIPQNDNSALRATGITTKQTTFLYGPGIGGGVSSSSGPLGTSYIAVDSAIADGELALQAPITAADYSKASLDSAKVSVDECLNR